MQNKNNIIIILDSILDDYYLVWECYSEYSQIKKNEEDLVVSFSKSLKEAFKLKYIDFFKGINFDGDESLITSLTLDDDLISQLLDWQTESDIQIRIKTSKLGVEFLNSAIM